MKCLKEYQVCSMSVRLLEPIYFRGFVLHQRGEVRPIVEFTRGEIVFSVATYGNDACLMMCSNYTPTWEWAR